MFSRYHRLFVSTCLSFAAAGVLVSATAQAGFEWTPPEQGKNAVPVDTDIRPVPALPEVEIHTPDPAPSVPAPVEAQDNDVEEVEIIKIDNTPPAPMDNPVEVPVVSTDTQVESHDVVLEGVKAMDEDDIAQIPADVPVEEPVDTAPMPAPASSLTINPYPLAGQGNIVEEEHSKDDVIHWNAPVTYDVIEGFGKDVPLALALRQIVPPQYAFAFGDHVDPGARVSWVGDRPWNEVLSDALAPIGVKSAVHGKKVVLSGGHAVPPALKKNEVKKAAPAKAVKDSMPEKQPAAPEKTEDMMNDALKEVYGDQGTEPSVPRVNILDPGQEESIQPTLPEDENSADQKKNEQPVKDLLPELAPEETDISAQADVADPVVLSDPLPTEMQDDSEAIDDVLAEDLPNLPDVDGSENPEESNQLDKETAESLLDSTDLEVESGNIALDEQEADLAEEASATDGYRTAPSDTIRVWEAKQGSDLQAVLEVWSEVENIPFSWDGDQSYDLEYDIFISGTFQNALEVLLSKGLSTPPPYTLSETPYALHIDPQE